MVSPTFAFVYIRFDPHFCFLHFSLRLEPPRRVAYCSKDCRDRDWDDGHSRICGKLYTSITQLGKESVPTEPPHSTSLLWQLFRTPSEGSEHPLPYVHRKWTSTPDTFDWINNPSAHLTEVLKQVMLRRDRESIRIFVILSWLCARLEGDDSWLHAVARQASEEWDLEYEEVREWLRYDQIESLLASQSPEWLKPPAAESS